MNHNENMITRHFKLIVLIAVVLIVIGGAGAWLIGGNGNGNTITLEETLEIADVDQVSISARNQRIQVRRVEGNEVRVVSSGVPANSSLTAEVSNGALTIESRPPRSIQIGVNFSGIGQLTNPPTLDVYLPIAMYERMQINSTNGRIEISDFSIYDLQIETTNSQIDVADIVGNINVRTNNGRINVSRITGEASRLRTTNGAIEISDVIGDIEAQTTNGRITFNNETIEQHVDLQSTNGGIEVNLRSEPEHAAFNLRTTNGRTEIFGNNNTSQQFGDGRYDVTLRTTNGRITVE